MHHEEKSDSKILKLVPVKKDTSNSEMTQNECGTDFEAVFEKNRQTFERLKKEREKANKSVLKSYKIKN